MTGPAIRSTLELRFVNFERDFDVSPYFQVIKPTIDEGFDYRALVWYTKPNEA